jgi:sugar lactone lactonase YvrE
MLSRSVAFAMNVKNSSQMPMKSHTLRQLASIAVLTLALALLGAPAASRADIIYVGNYNSYYIEKYDTGTGTDLGTLAQVTRPNGMAFDSAGNLYVVSWGTFTITKITPSGVASVLGTGAAGGTCLAFDSAGNLYAGDVLDNTIEKFTPGGVGSVFASTGLNYPSGLAFDKAGNLYVANANGNSIEKFTPAGVGSVFASTGLNRPIGLTFDKAGNLYAANYFGGSIEKFTPAGVGSVYGTVKLDPAGIAFDSAGNLFVADELAGPGLSNITKTPLGGGVGSVFTTSNISEPIYIAVIPEPSAIALLGLGLLGLLACRRRT